MKLESVDLGSGLMLSAAEVNLDLNDNNEPAFNFDVGFNEEGKVFITALNAQFKGFGVITGEGKQPENI